MNVNTTYRSAAPEIMDDFNMEGEILRDALDKIAGINRFLGGNKATLDGIKILIKNKPKADSIRIVDIGCGNGDMLRTLAGYACYKMG
jgi:2-polyprenyl-3-methyl-5-hydroxy-6-metoxy-1,4-benzoquinol methylase